MVWLGFELVIGDSAFLSVVEDPTTALITTTYSKTGTYDHRLGRTGHPVRSAIHNFQIGRLVVDTLCLIRDHHRIPTVVCFWFFALSSASCWLGGRRVDVALSLFGDSVHMFFWIFKAELFA